MHDMNRRERDALDRHITGNYGEDQFRDEDEDVDPFERDPMAPAMGCLYGFGIVLVVAGVLAILIVVILHG